MINSFVKKIKTGTFTFGTFKFIYNILFEAGQLSQLFDFQKSDASTSCMDMNMQKMRNN